MHGGQAFMPIDKYPWSQGCDRVQGWFGLTWQVSVVYESDPPKITPSMLFTKDQFGKAEEAINFYSGVFDNSSTTMLEHYLDGDANAGKVVYAEFKLNGYDLAPWMGREFMFLLLMKEFR